MKISALVLALAAGAMLTGCDQSSNQTATRSREPAVAPRSVLSVDSVIASRSPGSPSSLVVQASGTVGSTGWTDARLQAQPSAGGSDTLIYKFVAKPPNVESIATKISQPVETILRVSNVPTRVKGVRVVAETNQSTVEIKESGKPSPADMPRINSSEVPFAQEPGKSANESTPASETPPHE